MARFLSTWARLETTLPRFALARGVYRLANVPESANPDLALIAPRCASREYHAIRLGSLPVQTYRYDAATFSEGLESHDIGGQSVKIYSPARTVADCFKFRNKIGLDVALEALRLAIDRKRVTTSNLFHFARLLRVERVLQPYLYAAMKPGANIAESVVARVRNEATASKARFNQVLQFYAIERFLYRISKSPHADGVLLKGALLPRRVGLPRGRPTLDIDLLRRGVADRRSWRRGSAGSSSD